MGDDAFTDLANAVLRLRGAFLKHGLTPPKAIELGSFEDGARLRATVDNNLVHFDPGMGRSDSNPDMVGNLCGVEIRYPAKFRARERGGFDVIGR
jgi:hypothetical protein